MGHSIQKCEAKAQLTATSEKNPVPQMDSYTKSKILTPLQKKLTVLTIFTGIDDMSIHNWNGDTTSASGQNPTEGPRKFGCGSLLQPT